MNHTPSHPIAQTLPELRAQALNLTRSSADADDLLQDVAERALRLWPAYQPQVRELRAWLRLVLWQEFCRRYRRDQRQEFAAVSARTDLAGDVRRDVAILETQQDAAAPLAAVAALPDAQRRAVELVVLAGRSTAEAAAELGCEPATVRTRVHRGLKAVRSAVHGPGVDPQRPQPAQVVESDAGGVDGVVGPRHERALLG